MFNNHSDYDDNGQRVVKIHYFVSGSNETVYYIGNDFVRVVNSSGTYDTVYYYQNDKLVAERKPDNKTVFYHPDNLGSTSITTNSTGGLVEETTYTPFGDIYSGGTSERYTYTGKEEDSTGLEYFGARYRNPAIIPWTQPDTTIPNIYDPQSLNRYAYVKNNPYRYTDPDGNFALEVPEFNLINIQTPIINLRLTISPVAVVNEKTNVIQTGFKVSGDISSSLLGGASQPTPGSSATTSIGFTIKDNPQTFDDLNADDTGSKQSYSLAYVSGMEYVKNEDNSERSYYALFGFAADYSASTGKSKYFKLPLTINLNPSRQPTKEVTYNSYGCCSSNIDVKTTSSSNTKSGKSTDNFVVKKGNTLVFYMNLPSWFKDWSRYNKPSTQKK
jgi:RHS repeat-associated protein